MLTQDVVGTMLTSPGNSGFQHAQSVASQGSSPEPGCLGISLEVGRVDMTDLSLQPLQRSS